MVTDRLRLGALLLVGSVVAGGCGGSSDTPSDGDAGATGDGSTAADGARDSSVIDAGLLDTGMSDTSTSDTSTSDTGTSDTGVIDTGVVDTGVSDTGVIDSGTLDSGVTDASTGGDGGTSIGGSKDISVTVVKSATPTNTPVANAYVRASISATQFLDVRTDALGVAHLLVNPAMGPFDVTVAVAGHTAVSVLGVTDSIPGTLVINEIGAQPTFRPYAITGSIAGANAQNRVQIDSFDFRTLVTAVGATTYSSIFEVAAGLTVPIPLAAVEVDNSTPYGIAVNGAISAPIARQSAAMSIPVTMPSTPVPATQAAIHLTWPTAGVFTAATIKGVGNPVTDVHAGTGTVMQQTTAEASALMFVGVANIDSPMSGASLFHVQTFGGAMAPDFAGAAVSTVAANAQPTAADYVGLVYPHTLVDGTVVNVGQVNGITFAGTNLDTARFAIDSVGYDSTVLYVSNVAGATSTTLWIIYAPGGSVPQRGLPYLPGGVLLDDLGGSLTAASISGQVVKYVGATNPWQAVVADFAATIGNARATSLAPTGR